MEENTLSEMLNNVQETNDAKVVDILYNEIESIVKTGYGNRLIPMNVVEDQMGASTYDILKVVDLLSEKTGCYVSFVGEIEDNGDDVYDAIYFDITKK